MNVAHTAKADAPKRGGTARTEVTGSMNGGEVRINVTSNKMVGWVAASIGLFLSLIGGGFLTIVVHIWDDVDRHLDKLDSEVVALSVTQGKVEQFFTNQLPGIVQDLKANTSATTSLTETVKQIQTDQTRITGLVSRLQDQVSASALDIQRLKDAGPLQRQDCRTPDITRDRRQKTFTDMPSSGPN